MGLCCARSWNFKPGIKSGKVNARKFCVSALLRMNKDGEHGAAAQWSSYGNGQPISYAVHDGTEAQSAPCTPLFQGTGGDYRNLSYRADLRG